MELGTAQIIFKAWDLYQHPVSPTKEQTYVVAKQENGELGYFPTAEFALTSSNVFNGNQIISGNLDVTGTITGNINAVIITTGSIYMTGSIETVDHIDFSITANPTHREGRVHWVDDTKTLEIDTDVTDFMIEVGHQNVVRGRNINNFTLTKGTIVYIYGESGNRPNFLTASWEGDNRSATTLGFVAKDILQNQTGYVVSNGILRDINTTTYSPGDQLYLSSSGKFTKIIPDAPYHEVRVGKVITSAVQGTIYVDVMNGYELNELHDLKIYTGSLKDAATNNGGSLLYYSSSLWTNNDNVRLVQSTMVLASVSSSFNFANDTAAAAGGIPLGGLYHTSGSVKIRLV